MMICYLNCTHRSPTIQYRHRDFTKHATLLSSNRVLSRLIYSFIPTPSKHDRSTEEGVGRGGTPRRDTTDGYRGETLRRDVAGDGTAEERHVRGGTRQRERAGRRRDITESHGGVRTPRRVMEYLGSGRICN